MGFVSKVVGKLTGADKAAKATEQAARVQAEAIQQSSAAASKAARESAAHATRLQEDAAARNAAAGAAADALSVPLENPDIQLGGVSTDSSSATSRKRRQVFGVGSAGAGVNI